MVWAEEALQRWHEQVKDQLKPKHIYQVLAICATASHYCNTEWKWLLMTCDECTVVYGPTFKRRQLVFPGMLRNRRENTEKLKKGCSTDMFAFQVVKYSCRCFQNVASVTKTRERHAARGRGQWNGGVWRHAWRTAAPICTDCNETIRVLDGACTHTCKAAQIRRPPDKRRLKSDVMTGQLNYCTDMNR